MDTPPKYKVIYADPPWSWKARSAKGEDRSAKKHYSVMDLDDIKAMREFIDYLADRDCVLLMWSINTMLPQALEVIAAWGFMFKTVGFTWTKLNKDGSPFMGMGFHTRQNTEQCLLATRGNPQRLAKNVSQVIMTPKGKHSAKPPETRDRIEKLYAGPYIELFARDKAPNWWAWGHEVKRTE